MEAQQLPPEVRWVLLTALRETQAQDFEAHQGICGVLENAVDTFLGTYEGDMPDGRVWDSYEEWRGAAFRRWPKFSGSDCYPIPDPDADTGADAAAQAFIRTPFLEFFNPGHPYGALRCELVQFMIDELGAVE